VFASASLRNENQNLFSDLLPHIIF